MKERIRKIYRSSTLATKIRFSYLFLLLPMVLLLVVCLYNMWLNNKSYEKMVNSAAMASEFSFDFKKDFDYETYLLVVENKSIEESKLSSMLDEANRIVRGLESLTDSKENSGYLKSAKKYLTNLESYIKRIEENLEQGNRYEDNIEIWENDVQIVTTLLRETIFQYIHLEIQEIQMTREAHQDFFVSLITWLVVALVCILFVVILLSYYIPRSITKPIRMLSRVMEQVALGNLKVRAETEYGTEASAEISMLNDSLNTMIDKLKSLIEQVKEEQVSLRKAEFKILQAQINPHFLYNTLDAIVWLAEAGEHKKVVGMVGSLSDFFRTSLNQGKDIITIREEIQHVRSYLEIQQVRYQDILQYEIDISEELHTYLIPKITIQPLVENALYHGIKNRRGPGRITITGEKEKSFFILTIEDTGIGMKEERLKQVQEAMRSQISAETDIYGLYNVNERIRLNFGERYGISITSEYEKGTIARVVLPYLEE